jgi:CBS domain-containing protein
MKIGDVMNREVRTVRGDQSVREAAALMREANIGCVVIARSARIQGILTDRDLTVGCLAAGHDPAACTVDGHMSAPVITARPEMDLMEAAHLMTERRVKRLPIVEGDQLVGIVSFSDVAQALDAPMHDLLMGMGAARRVG